MEQANLGNVTHAYFSAPEGYVKFSISDDWSIQTFNLNAFGQTYVLEIKSRAEGEFGSRKHFIINLT